tara:strand:- start:30597 stop:31073 length:477 start_codon:yes stop_codon:yes gene_type:complete
MSNVKYAVSDMATVISTEESKAQFEELLALQWEEVDHRRKHTALNLDYDKYIKMAELGSHFMVFAFTKEELVGYTSMYISESPHTRSLVALTDSMYVRKEYRKVGCGQALITEAEAHSKTLGARDLMVTFKNDSPHPDIVKDLGFFSYETIYSKHIGG